MAARPGKTKGGKALRFACRNEERLRGRKVELEHFVNQYGVYICFLSETFLNPGQVVQLANYACHRTVRLTARGGTAVLVRRGTVHKSVSVPDRTHLEATVIQVILAGKPVKILAAKLSPSRPLIGTNLSTGFCGGLAGDLNLNAKHVDWTSINSSSQLDAIHTHTHTPQVYVMPPNSDHTQYKHMWPVICIFNQVQANTPWWWILCDPKHVGGFSIVCLLDF